MSEKIRILILEDSPEDARLIERKLGSSGIDHESVLASYGEEFSAVLEQQSFDLILADYYLRDTNGLEALQIAKRLQPDTPFILVSGLIGEELATKVMRHGADDYVHKERLGRLGNAVSNAVENASKKRELQQTTAALAESAYKYRCLFESAHDLMVQIDASGEIVDVNEKALKRYGYVPDDLLGKDVRSLSTFFSPASITRITEKFTRRMLGKKVLPYEVEGKKSDGSIVYFEVSGETLTDRTGKSQGEFALLHDITERKNNEEMLRSMSMQDDLTGLYNRRGFLLLAGQLLRNAKRTRRSALLIYADLDNMKWINDAIGHIEGDRALKAVADVLRSTFRESDILARIGGDEFVILALETPVQEGQTAIARLQENLAAYNSRSSEPFEISLSLGMTRFDPSSSVGIEELLGRADEKMYAHKNHKKKLRN